MNNTLYTIGQDGDNFYLDLDKAKREQERRIAIGDNNNCLQELIYHSTFGGKNSVIQVKYNFGGHLFSHGYIIKDNECYGCDIDIVSSNNTKWIECPDLLPMVYNWYLGFEQMYPEQKEIELPGILYELEKTSSEWIKWILNDENMSTLDKGVHKFGLNQELAAIVRLGYAESCYLVGDIEEGDKYIQRVDLTLSYYSNEKLDMYFKEILNLRNRRFKESRPLVLIRFKNY